MNNEIKIIDLIIAIQDNNLDKAKELVKYLNNNFIIVDNEINLEELLGLFNKNFDINNETIDYVLDNLNYLNNIDFLKWNRKISKLIFNKNFDEIKQFVFSQLESLTYNISPTTLYQSLIKISASLANNEESKYLLNYIRNYLINIENV